MIGTLPPGADRVFQISLSTGYVALGLLAVTLLLGPLNLLRRRPNPVSGDLRRDIGIWAGAVGLLHTGFGLAVHLRNLLPRDLVRPDRDGNPTLRLDSAGLANDLGLLAAIPLLALLTLSNDLALRTLGTRRWKAIQRLNYAVVALTVLHAILYQRLERRVTPYVALLAAAVAITVAAQLAGVWTSGRKGEGKAGGMHSAPTDRRAAG